MCLETGKLISRGHISGTKNKTFQNDEIKARGGGGTAIYGLYRYVSL